MIREAKKIIGLPVVTKGGESLGRLRDFQVDDASLKIVKLIVARSIISLNPGDELLIDVNQVIEITGKEIIVMSNLAYAPGEAIDLAGA
jgi:sporulation protein YlmC with PRC-barrel domain